MAQRIALDKKLQSQKAGRQPAELSIERALRQQIAVSELASALGELRDLKTIYRTIYKHVHDCMDAPALVISLYDGHTQLIHAEYMILDGNEQDCTILPAIPLEEPGCGTQSQVIRSGQPFYAPDFRALMRSTQTEYQVEETGMVREGPPPYGESEEEFTRSALFVPMRIGGKAIGVMQVQSMRLDAYSLEDRELLSAMANQAAIAIENTRLFRQAQQEIAERKQVELALQRKTYQQQRLIETARYLTESLDEKEVLGRIAQGATEILEAYGCTIYLLEPDGHTLTPVVAIDPDYVGEILAAKIDIDSSLTGQAVKTRHGFIFNDAISSQHSFHIPGTPEDQDERLIVVPLIDKYNVLGGMCLNRMGTLFTEEDLALAETFAAYASTALKNAQAHHRLQLEMEERRRAEVALRSSEERFRSAFHTSPDAININRLQDGKFIDINEGFIALTGYTQQDVSGKSSLDIDIWVDPKDRQRLIEGLQKNGFVANLEAQYRMKDGRIRTGLMSASIIYIDGEPHILSTTRDIQDRKRSEEALLQSEKRYRSLFDSAADSIFVHDLQGNILDANKVACERLGYTRDELRKMRVTEIDSPEFGALVPERLIELSTKGELFFETAHRAKDGSILPIELSAKVIEDNDQLVIQAIARDITERKRHAREQDAILTTSANLRLAQTRSEMPPVILDQVCQLLKADGAALALRDTLNGELTIELGQGIWANASGVCLPDHTNTAAHILMSGQPFLNNRAAESRHDNCPAIPALPPAVAGAPLIVQNETIGALWIGRNTDFTEEDLRILSAIGELAANAIHRATLFEETQRRLRQLDALHHIDKAITTNTDLEATLQVALEQVTAQLGMDAADILLYEPPTRLLVYAAGSGFHFNPTKRITFQLGASFAGQAALERRLIYVPDLKDVSIFPDPPLYLQYDENFVVYFGLPLIAKGQIKGVLELFHRSPFRPTQEWLDFLDTLAKQAAIAIDNASLFDELQRSNLELTQAYDTTLEGWARALELRDRETEGHSRRVTEMTLMLARAMDIGENGLIHIRRGALLHDIGKMALPDSILLKAGPLTDDEWEIMRQHPVYAYKLLSQIPFLQPALDIPHYHHEKWDGSGYPRHLKGEEIPLAARIFAVVDVWDALRSERPYRAAWPEEKVLEYLRQQAGSHFEPKIVQLFFDVCLRQPQLFSND